jgi:nucleotide-binding universal stress UspA family protein
LVPRTGPRVLIGTRRYRALASSDPASDGARRKLLQLTALIRPGTPSAGPAARRGEARRLGGRAVAVFVGPTPGAASATATASLTGAAVAYGTIQQSMTVQAEELADQVRAYGDEHRVDVGFVRTHGDTARELLRIANADHADLLVVGRSTKARHHLAGSLGRRLVGRRGAPIIVGCLDVWCRIRPSQRVERLTRRWKTHMTKAIPADRRGHVRFGILGCHPGMGGESSEG